ncbi:MAG: sigma-70 family RNA polymerase sigma factor [Verrucomicrobia bacterium]|nr:MAG: sigma-70 family RNA polymerase sigma factor [Verrucomicrobiota bacterium]
MSDIVVPGSSPDADIEAMKRLAEGDDLALNEIMNRWKNPLAAYLYRTTGSREVAADLSQETFVRLYQSRERYRPSAAFPTYLFHIASNLARNHARWRKRHPSVSIEEFCLKMQELQGDDVSPDQAAVSKEWADCVDKALARLPEDLREALHLFTYEEMTQHQIALTLGCSVKAVESRIYRARQFLKEILLDLQKS